MYRVVLKYMAPLLRPCLKHTHTTKQVYVNMCPWMLCFQAMAHFKTEMLGRCSIHSHTARLPSSNAKHDF